MHYSLLLMILLGSAGEAETLGTSEAETLGTSLPTTVGDVETSDRTSTWRLAFA